MTDRLDPALLSNTLPDIDAQHVSDAETTTVDEVSVDARAAHPVTTSSDVSASRRAARTKQHTYTREQEKDLLKQMTIKDFNPYIAGHKEKGKTWEKLAEFMRTEYGAETVSGATVKRHVDTIIAKREKEVKKEAQATGTNVLFGEFEQLVDEHISVIREFTERKENQKEEEETKKKIKEQEVIEIRSAAMKRLSQQESSSPKSNRRKKNRKRNTQQPSPSKYFLAEQELSKERNLMLSQVMESSQNSTAQMMEVMRSSMDLMKQMMEQMHSKKD